MKKNKTKKYYFGSEKTQELLNDPAQKSTSVLVPDDIKDKVRSWARDMGLSPELILREYIIESLKNSIGC